MTSSVTVTACCPDSTEVVILEYCSDCDTKEYVLQNGGTKQLYVFDNKTVEVFERKK